MGGILTQFTIRRKLGGGGERITRVEAARRHGRVVPLARAGGDGPPDGRVFDGPGALEGRPNQQELPRLRGERVLDVVRRARFTRVDDAAVTRANEVLGAAEPELQLPKQCRGRAHTELEGGVVKWGSNNIVADAAACCEACRSSEAKGCNVWVFCGDRDKCGDRFGQCWLKHTDDPTDPPSRGSSLAAAAK